MHKPFLYIFFSSQILFQTLFAQEQVDIGIFPASTPDTLVVKLRPTFNISGQSVTNVQFTIRWSESSSITQLDWIFSILGLFPQGGVVIDNGYRYQVFASSGGSSLNWNANQEYTVLKVKTGSTTGDCTKFEIAADDWTSSNNGDYYFEILGIDKTGIFYEPYVNFGSEGGWIDGDTTIYLGNSTGPMILMDYNGEIIYWERRIDGFSWGIISGTAGQTTYEEIPTGNGIWEYRAKVQYMDCGQAYSETDSVTVELLAIWTGAVNTTWENPGNWNVVGVPDENTDGLIPVVTSNYYPWISSAAYCKNLTIDSGANLIVSPSGEMNLSGSLINNGEMLIKADATGTGSLINAGLISGAGDFSNECFFYDPGYHMVSSPVISSQAAVFLGCYMYSWDESSNQWVNINDPGYLMNSMEGYMIICPDSDTSTHVLNGEAFLTGQISKSLTNNGSGQGHLGGYNFIGNPYPSAINWNSPEGWSIDQADPAIYIYNPETGNYGCYIKGDPASCINGVDSIIASTQAFFVHVNHEYASGGIAVNNLARIHEHRNILNNSPADNTEPYIRLRIYLDFRDEVIVRFDDNSTPLFDSETDAYDMAGSMNAPQLFTRSEDTLRLAINTFPELNENVDIQMGFIPSQNETYTLNVVEMSNFGPDTLVFLEDLKLDQLYLLSEGIELQIPALIGDDLNRFILHFHTDPVGLSHNDMKEQLIIYSNYGQIHIICQEDNVDGEVKLIDMTGRIIHQQNTTGRHSVIDQPDSPGLYIVQFLKDDKIFSELISIP